MIFLGEPMGPIHPRRTCLFGNDFHKLDQSRNVLRNIIQAENILTADLDSYFAWEIFGGRTWSLATTLEIQKCGIQKKQKSIREEPMCTVKLGLEGPLGPGQGLSRWPLQAPHGKGRGKFQTVWPLASRSRGRAHRRAHAPQKPKGIRRFCCTAQMNHREKRF